MYEKVNLIAPCGMNCSICMAYLREKINAMAVEQSILGIQKQELIVGLKIASY